MTGRGGEGEVGVSYLTKIIFKENFSVFENWFPFLFLLSCDQILERTVPYRQNPDSKTFFLLISKKVKSV